MESYSNDLNVKFEHTPVTNKVAFNLNHVGAHAGDAIDVTSLSHTDADTIYLNGSTGSDSNDGTSANPKLTILASINATTSAKIYVLVMNSQHFAEDLSTATTTFLTGLFANTAITATLSTRTLGYTPADANSIFFGATSGTGGGAGTEADPTNTIALAVGLTDGTHNNIVEVDGDTYTEPAIEMTGNFTGMYAADGVKPTFKPTISDNNIDFSGVAQLGLTTEFESGDSEYISTGSMANGNFVIAFRDVGDSNFGKFMIYNSSGTVLKAATAIDSTNATIFLDVGVLSDDSFVIVWRRSVGGGNMMFAIYDSDGTETKAPTSIEASLAQGCKVGVFSDDDFVVCWSVDSSTTCKFAVLDSAGSIVTAVTTWSVANEFTSSALSVLSNDDWVFGFVDLTAAPDNGKFFIKDKDGVDTKALTVFESQIPRYVAMGRFSTDNWVIAYNNQDNTNGEFVIYDSSGTVVSGPTEFDANTPFFNSIDIFNNDMWVINYADQNDGDKGNYSVWNSSGVNQISNTVFESGATEYTSTSILKNGTWVCCFSDVGDSGKGKFVIYNPWTWSGLKILAASDINGYIIDGNDSYQLTKLIEVSGAKPTIKWNDLIGTTNPSTATLNGYAIAGDNETDVSNCKIYDNDAGIYLTANVDNCIIQDCEFYRNEGTHAIRIDGAAASSGDITIEHNDVFNNNAGIRLENNNGTNEILKNNIIHNNDNFGVEADTSVSLTYTVRTDSNSGATDGTSVILANPLYINEGAVSPAAIDLNIKTTVEGYPSDSPAKDLADDSRNAGSHDVRYIGAATTWTSITVPKDRRNSPKIWYEPVAGSKSIGQDGTVEYSKKGQTENVKIKWTGLLNADFVKVRKMWMSDGSEVRIYWQPTTTPNTYTTYTMTRRPFNAGVNHYELSRTGVSDFEVEFSRKYEEA